MLWVHKKQYFYSSTRIDHSRTPTHSCHSSRSSSRGSSSSSTMQIAHRRRQAAAAVAISAVAASVGVGDAISGVGVTAGDASRGLAGVRAGATVASVRLSRITRFRLRPLPGGADLDRDSRPNTWGSHGTKHIVLYGTHARSENTFRIVSGLTHY